MNKFTKDQLLIGAIFAAGLALIYLLVGYLEHGLWERRNTSR